MLSDEEEENKKDFDMNAIIRRDKLNGLKLKGIKILY